MQKRNLVLQAAVMSALAISASSAFAASSPTRGATNNALLVGTGTVYSAQGIPATGTVTIKAGATYNALGTTGYLTDNAGVADKGLITITLPTGVTFSTAPLATPSGFQSSFSAIIGAPLTIVAGGVGQQFITYDAVVPVRGLGTGAIVANAPVVYGAAAAAVTAAAQGAKPAWAAAGATATDLTVAEIATVTAALAAVNVATVATTAAALPGSSDASVATAVDAAFGTAYTAAIAAVNAARLAPLVAYTGIAPATVATEAAAIVAASGTVTAPGAPAVPLAVVPTALSASLTLGSFTVTGPGSAALATAGNKISLTAQSAGFLATSPLDPLNANNGNNDATPVLMATAANLLTGLDNVAISADQFVATVTQNNDNAAGGIYPVTTDLIDITQATLIGTTYVPTATTIAASANLGTVTLQDLAWSNSFATANFVLPAQTMTVAGDYTNVTGVYAVTPVGAACAATAPVGAISGVINATRTAATFTGMAATVGAGTTYRVCKLGSTTSLLRPSTHATSFMVGTVAYTPAAPNLSPLQYNGAVVEINTMAGPTSSVQNVIRLTNPTSTAVQVLGVLTTDEGVVSSGLITTLAANTSALILDTAIYAGLVPVPTILTQARMDVLTSSAAVTVDNIIVNKATGAIAGLSNNNGNSASGNH